MKIGILSDSHDNLAKIEKAVKFFNQHKVSFVLHAGDFIAPFTISRLEKLRCDWRGVFGNNDGEKTGLTKHSKGKIKSGPLRIKLGGKAVTLVHDINTLNLSREKAHLVFCGHTHKPEIKICGKNIVVNPGECGGWLTGKSSVAIADLTTLSVRICQI